ncbi:LytR/AlgR family response regulator transcription factor [Parendozoicomonas haliclonae]|uniref:Transcriptional regulatory protein YehT n=1 Tax=Parendozoicomonas haliclonae TaxID=1960125 RepID=A0A1X7AJD9_9GAMM|nr:LytTR family DNA-binding domain-containing protein [Parendozoicomonas haliclonae]SMA45795.1 Transcriptional regulatory protein YehT [Parendozoicomonas haliclonae]
MKVLICDDEPLARERTRVMLERIDGVTPLDAEAGDGARALELIEQFSPDAVLLDIRMPGMDGLECANRIAQMDTPPAVIFCTAYNDHALEAFKAQAIDYLLKPIRQNNLEDALLRTQKLTQSQLTALHAKQAEDDSSSHISARTHKGIELIPVDDITMFQADQKYVTVCYNKGEVLIDEPLKSLQERLGESFVRIHRNALVSHRAIQAMQKNDQGSYELRLKNLDEPVTVSRRHVSAVKRLLSQR